MIWVMGWVLIAPIKAENWPQWRGPTHDGVSHDKSLPVEWSRTKNVAWRTEVPGIGHSSPIVWDNQVIVTSSTGPAEDRRWWILSYSTKDGSLLWKTQVSRGEAERAHRKHGSASSTPATDGKRIYAFLGNGGLVAVDMKGLVLWHTTPRQYVNPWGAATSPLVDDKHVYFNGDDDIDSFLAAYDKQTGKEVWKTARPGQIRSFSTPALVNVDDRKRELVVNGHKRVMAYDPQTGKEQWTVEGAMPYVTPTPIVVKGLVMASSGRAGPTFAIRPGGRGDVTTSHVAWKAPTGSPYISSPVAWENHVFMVNGTGIGQCLDAKTGKLLWRERLATVSEGYSNSPIAANGLFYVLDEEGTCQVLVAGDKFKRIASNRLEERCLTSPAASAGKLFIRTDDALYCIGAERSR